MNMGALLAGSCLLLATLCLSPGMVLADELQVDAGVVAGSVQTDQTAAMGKAVVASDQAVDGSKAVVERKKIVHSDASRIAGEAIMAMPSSNVGSDFRAVMGGYPVIGAPTARVKKKSGIQPSKVKSVYYPGFLSYYPYADGSFVYDPEPPVAQAEVRVVSSTPIPPQMLLEPPETRSVSSVAAFAPGQPIVSQVILSGFSVHVGSFLEHVDADSLENQLHEQGIPTFRTPVLLNGISYVQLHAGPFEGWGEAEEMGYAISSALDVQGVVLFHGL